ncbi:hypothetical protein AQ861_14825 [Burkholderia pseudomallei]|nr:hypothetical protein AQ861_14825 [Burkholderia pseudomallei]
MFDACFAHGFPTQRIAFKERYDPRVGWGKLTVSRSLEERVPASSYCGYLVGIKLLNRERFDIPTQSTSC